MAARVARRPRPGVCMETFDIWSYCETDTIKIPRRVWNLNGAQFDVAITREYKNLMSFSDSRRIPPELTSSYSISNNLPPEPIVDCYVVSPRDPNRRTLIEIKKGFHMMNGKRYVSTSPEQLKLLIKGLSFFGTKIHPGQIWVYSVPKSTALSRSEKVVVTRTVIPTEVLKYLLHNYVERTTNFYS